MPWATVDDDSGPLRVCELGVIRAGGELTMVQQLRDTTSRPSESFIAYSVEVPVPSRSGNLGNAPVKDIRNLAVVAGAAALWLANQCPMSEGGLCEVKDWKGQVPKVITQRRIAKRLGWSIRETNGKEPYCYPVDFGLRGAPHSTTTIKKADWKHIFDAVGIALYAYDLAIRKSRLGL